MISFVIAQPRKQQGGEGTGWLIMHPSNSAILAYCDTEEEADRVVALLAEIAERFREEAIGESGARS